jgi:hypothetical protein
MDPISGIHVYYIGYYTPKISVGLGEFAVF